MAVLTGMVKREQVYMPSSDSVTSLILMVNSDHDACTSSILLSLKAGQRDRQIVSKLYKLFKYQQTKLMTVTSAAFLGDSLQLLLNDQSVMILMHKHVTWSLETVDSLNSA